MSEGEKKEWSDGKRWFMRIIAAVIVILLTILINHVFNFEKDNYGISFAQSTLKADIADDGVIFTVNYHLLSTLEQNAHLFIQVYKDKELKDIIQEKEVSDPNTTSQTLMMVKAKFDIAYVRLCIKGSNGKIISRSESVILTYPQS